MPQGPSDKCNLAKQVLPEDKISWDQVICIITPSWRESQVASQKNSGGKPI